MNPVMLVYVILFVLALLTMYPWPYSQTALAAIVACILLMKILGHF